MCSSSNRVEKGVRDANGKQVLVKLWETVIRKDNQGRFGTGFQVALHDPDHKPGQLLDKEKTPTIGYLVPTWSPGTGVREKGWELRDPSNNPIRYLGKNRRENNTTEGCAALYQLWVESKS